MILIEKERDNLLRWDGASQGWYEVYYLKWNDLVGRTAGWVRYTLTSPSPGQGEPYCELWGICFDALDPAKNFALKQRYPIGRLEFDRNRFRVAVAGAELSQHAAAGALEDRERGLSLSWRLEFDSAGPSFHHFPDRWMYESSWPKTKVLAPHQRAMFRGEVLANGRVISLRDAPGQQAHLWGRKHALRWAWGHCAAFAEDPEAVWEGLDSQIQLGPLVSPHLSLFHLNWQGREYRFNAIGRLIENRSRWELGRWGFAAEAGGLAMLGAVACRYEEMVGVTYTDPDGDKLWCNNSKVATIRLELRDQRGRKLAELNSDRACAAEFVDRRIYPAVPPRI